VNLAARGRFGYDGSSELWFEIWDGSHTAFASPEGRAQLAGLPNFAPQADPVVPVETQMPWP